MNNYRTIRDIVFFNLTEAFMLRAYPVSLAMYPFCSVI